MQSYFMNTLLFGVFMLGILFFANREIGNIQTATAADLSTSEGASTTETFRDDPLNGHRAFSAGMRFGQLSLHGAAFTFEDEDDTSSYVPYNFAFRTDQFTQTPRMDDNIIDGFYGRYKASFPTVSGVLTNTCVNSRDSTADGIALTAPIVCQMMSAQPNQQMAMIGVIQPNDNTLALDSGDATCRGEVSHWRSLPGFQNIKTIVCIVVDKPYNPDARSASEWMDVIYYQQASDTLLLNLQATDRNS